MQIKKITVLSCFKRELYNYLTEDDVDNHRCTLWFFFQFFLIYCIKFLLSCQFSVCWENFWCCVLLYSGIEQVPLKRQMAFRYPFFPFLPKLWLLLSFDNFGVMSKSFSGATYTQSVASLIYWCWPLRIQMK